MNVTCHMMPIAHGHGVRYSLHRLQQPEGDLQHLQMLTFRGLFEDKDSVSINCKKLFLQFIIEIDVKSESVTVSHSKRTKLVNINMCMKK